MSQQDTYDLKPDAPAQFRGPYRPIATVGSRALRSRSGSPGRRGSWTGSPLVRSVHHGNAIHAPSAALDADRLFRADAGAQRPPEAVVRLGDRPRRRARSPDMPAYVTDPQVGGLRLPGVGLPGSGLPAV